MGQTDVPSTEKAIFDAKKAAKRFTGKPSWIVSSPLKRARATAEAFLSVYETPFYVDPLWMERCWGPYEGQPKSKRHEGDQTEGVEEWGEFLDRIARGVAALPKFGEGMIVSHSGVYRALSSLGYKSSYAGKFLKHASPIKLTLEN